MTPVQELSAEQVIAVHLGGDQPACLTCSFQAEDMVVLDLARRVRAEIPVLFLETGYHFAETYAYRDRYRREWNLNLINLAADLSVRQQESQFGILHQTNPTECCRMRKVEPLFRGLGGYRIWLTGLRREQSPTRANLKKVEPHVLPDGRSLLKLSPLADWTTKDVWRYLRENNIDPLPLYERGYTSIGCAPCTALPADPNNPRSGRWGGVKLECGIHTFSERKEP
ncbi:MAG: phosphoadenylyl-sulfate reductase [Acidobacteria bacterium]|nr:phosphoadenylyl-sulfate reductase [Acidobacteriota bacterium]